MRRNELISVIWKLTIASFFFVQVVGVTVITVILMNNDRTLPKSQVMMAYGVFLLFSGCLLVATKAVKRMVDEIYRD
jgi:hypothetical protein